MSVSSREERLGAAWWGDFCDITGLDEGSTSSLAGLAPALAWGSQAGCGENSGKWMTRQPGDWDPAGTDAWARRLLTWGPHSAQHGPSKGRSPCEQTPPCIPGLVREKQK